MSNEELPWRSQANLLVAISGLDLLLERLRGTQEEEAGEEEEEDGEGEVGVGLAVPSEWLRFESAEVMVEGIIPVHAESLPGHHLSKVHINTLVGLSILVSCLFTVHSKVMATRRWVRASMVSRHLHCPCPWSKSWPG